MPYGKKAKKKRRTKAVADFSKATRPGKKKSVGDFSKAKERTWGKKKTKRKVGELRRRMKQGGY